MFFVSKSTVRFVDEECKVYELDSTTGEKSLVGRAASRDYLDNLKEGDGLRFWELESTKTSMKETTTGRIIAIIK